MRQAYDLACIHRGSLNEEWVTSALEVQRNYPWNRLWISPGKKLVFDKNEFTMGWLDRGETDWLVWVDEGMRFSSDAVDKIVNFTVQPAVVAGLWYHFSPDFGRYPGIFWTKDRGKLFVDSVREIPNVPFKAEGSGGGFMAIHRTVAETLRETVVWHDAEYPFFRVCGYADGRKVGYSEYFALRVGDAGFPYWIHPDARVSHFETVEL